MTGPGREVEAGASLSSDMAPSERIFSDTSREVENLLIDIYRRMPSWRKIELVEDANRTARQLAWAGLHSRHPGETKARLRRRLLDLVLGEETANKIYDVPDLSDALGDRLKHGR